MAPGNTGANPYRKLIKMGKIVQVKTIPRDTASRVHEIRNIVKKADNTYETGEPMKKTKISPACKDSYQILYSKKVGGLKTGLYNKVSNPHYVDPKEFKTDKDYKAAVAEAKNKLDPEFYDVVDQKQITRQELLEIKHSRPRGFYTNRHLGRNAKPADLTYMQSFNIKFNDGSTFFDLDIPEHEIAYYAMLEHKNIANSWDEYRRGLWPYATHVIVNESESAKEKFNKARAKAKALAKLEATDYLDQKKICKVLDLQQGHIDEQAAYTLLYNFLDRANPSKDKNIDKFMEVAELMDTAPGREELDAKAMLEDLVHYRVVRESGGTYTWPKGGKNGLKLGNRYQEAVNWLLDATKDKEIEMLEEELSLKRDV